MDEINTSKSDLPADLESASSDRVRTSLQKIYRKGNKIYQVSSLDENVSMIKEDNDQIKHSNDLTDGQVDEVSSGESLYKVSFVYLYMPDDIAAKAVTVVHARNHRVGKTALK